MTTHVLMVTDMSGSMSDLAEDVRGGFNTYLDSIANEYPDVDFRITAAVFDTEYISLCVDSPLTEAPRLNRANYSPRGGTALLDAVGRTIGGFELRVPDLGDDDKVCLVIQTDGHENSSREFTYESVKKLIDERTRDGGKWAVLYIGAGADTWDQANAMGVAAANYVHTSGSAAATGATYTGLAAATFSVASGGTADDASRIVRKATQGK